MKAIPGNNAGPQWGNQLFDDLVFIKKHRRYPLGKKMIIPVLSILFLVLFGTRMIYTSLFIYKTDISVMLWIAMVFVVLGMFGMTYSFYNILRFRSIPTPFPAMENMKLVDEFLRSQQLNVYHHPQAPEVLQILSRPLGNSEQREVMILIADDKRILVNSHIINQKWTISPPSRNSRQMAHRLKEWLKIHYPDTALMAQ